MPSKIIFYSSNLVWGGSEVLWYQSALRLAQTFPVSVIADHESRKQDYLVKLPASNVAVNFFNGYRKRFILNRFIIARDELRQQLKKEKPSLVVISLGAHYMAGHLPSLCREAGIPYVLVFQLVNDDKWIETESKWNDFRQALQGAVHCYFVSDANQAMVERMIASKLPNAKRIHNPFQVDFTLPFSFPEAKPFYKLACVGRYSVNHKGQDVLLEVLAQEKWKGRELKIDLIGGGPCKLLLEELIKYYGIRNVTLPGYTHDLNTLWSGYHGLMMPSRREGSSLALMEALVMGRVPVCTAVGSAPELIEDNVNGFLAKYAHAEFIDDALERAWKERERWESIGRINYDRSRILFKGNPVEVFCDEIKSLIG